MVEDLTFGLGLSRITKAVLQVWMQPHRYIRQLTSTYCYLSFVVMFTSNKEEKSLLANLCQYCVRCSRQSDLVITFSYL